MDHLISPGTDPNVSTAIVCKDVPAEYDRLKLRTHFSRFGGIAKIFTSPDKQQASIYFDNRASAAAALKHGKDGTPMKIFWKRPARRASEDVVGSLRKGSRESESADGDGINRAAAGVSLPPAVAEPKSLPPIPAVLFGKAVVEQQSVPSLSVFSKVNSPANSVESMGPFAKPPRGRTSGAFAFPTSPPSGLATESEKCTPNAPRRREPSPAPDTSTCGDEKLQFSQLRGAVGTTTEERYRILDAWSKHIKQGLQKQSDISTARATKGTCPDMCPEKERYMRDFQRRVHIYETLPGTESNPLIDHSRAVKEYSRSSADQEEPLPSELRPPYVLERTMNYLVAQIMDAGDSRTSWGDWYDFLWDRTRGIRKDITQQHLCDEIAVSLVEKCARFHVLCAERLCEEAAQAFDRKINDENLTKCLQTLREMYHDLRRVRSVPCPNEAEFRGYMVLMKLNEGDTLRDVQQLDPDIRKSSEIQFVLAVYSSLDSFNYARFFKLLKCGTFLNACLMHRYFTQIRLRAVDIMLKAYKDRSTKFSMDEFVRILNFENSAEALEFCHYYGLNLSTPEYVTLLRTSDYVPPEMPLRPRRAVSLIERKMTSSIGQVVNGGLLPDVVLTVPKSSFDADNRFTTICSEGNRIMAAEPSSSASVAVATSPHRFSAVSEPPPASAPNVATVSRNAITEELLRDIAADTYLTLIGETIKDVVTDVLLPARALVNAISQVAVALLHDVIDASTRAVAKEVYSGCQAECVAQREAEALRIRDGAAVAAVDELLRQVTAVEALSVASEVYSLAVQERQEGDELRELAADAVADGLVSDVTQSLAELVATEYYRTHVAERLAELERCDRAVRLCKLRRLLARWRVQIAARRRLRTFYAGFPPCPSLRPDVLSCSNVEHGLKCQWPTVDLAGGDPDDSSGGRRLRLQACVLAKRLKLAQSIFPIDVARVVAAKLADKADSAAANVEMPTMWSGGRLLGNVLCFKLLLLLPSCGDASSLFDISTGDRWPEFIADKLRFGPTPVDPHASTASKAVAPLLSLCSVQHGRWQVCSCIRQLSPTELCGQSVKAIAASGMCRGTTAVMYVLPMRSSEAEAAYWLPDRLNNCRSQLKLALDTRPSSPPVPLLVVAPVHFGDNPHDNYKELRRRLTLDLQLDELCELGLVSAIRVIPVDIAVSANGLTNMLVEGLEWLATHSPPEPNVRLMTAVALADGVLSRAFYEPIYEDLAVRQKVGLPHQEPDRLLTLYNGIIDQLAEAAAVDSIASISWPPMELCPAAAGLPFYGNSGATANNNADAVHRLRQLALPRFGQEAASGTTVDELSSWSEACRLVSTYAWQVCNCDEVESVALFSSLRGFLKKAMISESAQRSSSLASSRHLNSGGSIAADNLADRQLSGRIPWTDLVAMCIEHRLSTVLSSKDHLWLLQEHLDGMLDGLSRRVPRSSGVGMLPGANESVAHRAAASPYSLELSRETGRRTPCASMPLSESVNLRTYKDSVTAAAAVDLEATPAEPGCFFKTLDSIRQTLADERVLSEEFERRLAVLLQDRLL